MGTITDNIIKLISEKCNIVFILWGNLQNQKRDLSIRSTLYHRRVHPSPLACKYNLKGTLKVFGHNYFNKANEYLIKII